MRDLSSSPEGPSPGRPGRPPAAGTPRPPAARRRAYTPPQLIEWGSLAQLTLGGAGIDYDIDNGATKAV